MVVTVKRGIYAIVAISIVGTALWFLRRHDAHKDQGISSPVLKANEQEKIIIDPLRHRITTVTRTGPVKRTFLPPHPVSVTVGTDGKVTVQERQYGTEVSPFLGFAYSDRARLALGADLLYWHRWEMGVFAGVSVSGGTTVRVGARVAYNLYSNTSLFVGVDNMKAPVGGVSFKF